MTLLLLFNQPAAPSGSSTGTAFRSFVEAGMLRGEWDFDGTLAWTACTHDATGAAADADAAPTWVIRNAATGAQVATGTMDAVAGVTGQYLDTLALSTANGFAADTLYVLRVEATVGGVVAAAADVFGVKVPIGRDASGYIDGITSTAAMNTLDSVITAIQGADGDTLETLSDQVDAISAGAGSGTGTYTDTVTDGTNPLDGVRVQLSTDSAKANPVYQAYTNALGVFLFHPDPGAYFVWFEKAGSDFSAVNGTGVTVT